MSEDNIFVKWKPELKRGAKTFYDEICLLDEQYKQIIEYHEEAFDKIHEKYSEYREKLHIITEGPFIDRHKVVAAILLACTNKDNQIFRINKESVSKSPKNKFPFFIGYLNEIYLCQIILSLLSEFILATKKFEELNLKCSEYNVSFPAKVICWETSKTRLYSEHFIVLLSLLKTEENYVSKCLLVLSHLMFFHELAYDCAVVTEIRESYYDLGLTG